MKISRRGFLCKSTAGVVGATSISSIVSSCVAEPEQKAASVFASGSAVLFQGDSITDAGRDKQNEAPNRARSFGNGYAFLAASCLLNKYAKEQLTIYNRGISGNKVFQLANRWQKDCLDLKPDVLSVLIGVNDYWHKRNGRYDGTVDVFKNDYRALMQRTQEKLPGIKLVLCEPFYVLETSAVDETWIEPMQQYQIAAKQISDEFETIWVPFQKVFDEATKYAPGKYWAPDGVHPSMAGAELMAEAWLKAVGEK